MDKGILTAIPLISLVGYGILLFIVFGRGLREPVNRFFAFYLFCMLVASFGALMMYVDPQRVSLWNKVMLSGMIGMPWAFYGFVEAFLGRRVSGWRLNVGAGLALVLLWRNALGYLTAHIYFDQDGLLDFAFGPAVDLYAVYFVLYIGSPAIKLVQARQRARSALQRNRISYALLGMVVIVLGSMTNFVPSLGAYPLDVASQVINALMLTYAISRYQLLDIGFLVRRGFVYYVFPAAIIGSGYFLITFLAFRLLPETTSYQIITLAVVLSAVAAAITHFLRDEVQDWADRLFFRRRYDAGLMLQKISHRATAVLDIHNLTEMILAEISAIMDTGRATFFLKQEESGEFQQMAGLGLDEGLNITLRADHPVVEWLANNHDALRREQMGIIPQFQALWTEEREDLNKIDVELIVPLLVRDELIGILVVGPKQTDVPYTVDEQLTLITLANQTAVAVENAHLFSREQLKAKESAALLEIAQAIVSTLDLLPMLQIIAQKMAEVCEAYRCTFLLVDEEEMVLIPLMSQLHDGSVDLQQWRTFKNRVYSIDDAQALKQTIREQLPGVMGKGSMSQVLLDWVQPFSIKSMLSVPLVNKDRLIGLAVLDHIENDYVFSDEQVNLATTIGSQVAVAIENARLYEEVVEKKETTEAILQQAFAGIMVIDTEMRIVTLNPGAEAITGYTAQKVLGRRLPEVFGPDMWSEGSLVQQAMAGQPIVPGEALLVGGNGARDVLLGVTSLRDGYLLNFADITHLKEVDRLKSEFVANVSHELRTPLACIKAYVELLLDGMDSSEEALRQRFLSMIDQESDRLADLITDLLDLSRLEQGGFELEKSYLSVSTIVDEVVSLLGVQAQERGISLNIDLSAYLPIISANRNLMTTLIKNLLGNAIKFSHDGEQVELVVRVETGDLIIDVVDQGIGISPEELPLLFEKFYRTPRAVEAGIDGTGLGLVLVKEAAQAHDGTVEVVSNKDVGTRFTVTLPINGDGDHIEEVV